jgi:hypothetical protein
LLALRQGLDQLIDRFAAGVIALGQQGGDALVQGLEALLAGLQFQEPLPDRRQQGRAPLRGVMFGELHVASEAAAGILV